MVMFDSVDGMCSKCYQPIQKVNKDDDNKDTDFPEIRTIKMKFGGVKRTAILATRWNYIYISIFNIIMKFNSKNSINKRKVVNND